MLTADELSTHTVRHGFFTRHGGVSRPPYKSLNCGLGSGDDPERVERNRSRAMDGLGLPAGALATARQVHSARVVVVDRPWPAAHRPEADALVSRRAGVALGILTADCAPVLFADAQAGVIGAAHAGWRGAKAGVVENTVAAMAALGARREAIVAAVGPCIARASYEVGAEFRAAFLADEPETAVLFGPADREDHFRFDLAGYVERRLAAAGIATLKVLAGDTFADAERFFSFRRTTLAGERDYGRQLSAIAFAG